MILVLSKPSKKNLKRGLNKKNKTFRKLEDKAQHILLGTDNYRFYKKNITFFIYILHLIPSGIDFNPADYSISFNYTISNQTGEIMNGKTENITFNTSFTGTQANNTEENEDRIEDTRTFETSFFIENQDTIENDDPAINRLLRILSKKEEEMYISRYSAYIDLVNEYNEIDITKVKIYNFSALTNGEESNLDISLLAQDNIENVKGFKSPIDYSKLTIIDKMENTQIYSTRNSDLILRADRLSLNSKGFDNLENIVLNITNDINYNCSSKYEETKFILDCKCTTKCEFKSLNKENLNNSMAINPIENKYLVISLDDDYIYSPPDNNIKFRTTSNSLSAGGIVGIVIATIVVVFAITLIAIYFSIKKPIPKQENGHISGVDSSANINNN